MNWLLAAGDNTFLDYASKGGIVGLLVVILFGGFKKDPWWVFGWVYKDLCERQIELRKEKDSWRDTALAGKDIGVTLTKKIKEGEHE